MRERIRRFIEWLSGGEYCRYGGLHFSSQPCPIIGGHHPRE